MAARTSQTARRHRTGLAAAAGLLGLLGLLALLAACGNSYVENEDAFLRAARADVVSVSAYDDDELLQIADRLCEAGATNPGQELLAADYSRIAADEREQLAYIALTEACPEWSGTGTT